MKRAFSSVAALALAACAGRTMPPANVPAAQRFPAALLSHYADSIAFARSTGFTFSNTSAYKVIEGRRWESGGPEVHDDWTDVMIVQAGRATVLTGGHLEESRLNPPGEHRGGTIVGGKAQVVNAGDVVVIPAGTPHQSQLATGDTLRYLTIKVPR
jgi:mannose-6-phosphate isomerase-like protein (cupin superfamily)